MTDEPAREGGGEAEGERGMREEIRDAPGAIREDARGLYRDADEKLSRQIEEKPALDEGLRIRTALIALAIAFVVALILRLVGLTPLLSIVVFLVVLAAAWFGLATFTAARRPTDGRGQREREDDEGKSQEGP